MKKTPLRWIATALATALFGQAMVLQLLPIAASAQEQSSQMQSSATVQNTDLLKYYESEILRAKIVWRDAYILAGTGKYVGKTPLQVQQAAHAYAEKVRGLISQLTASSSSTLPPPPKPTPTVTPSTSEAPATPSTSPAPSTSPSTTLPNDLQSLMDNPPNLNLTSGTVKIVGGTTCVTKTQEALNLLKTKAPLDYNRVVRYVGTIECVNQGSGMWAWQNPPRYTVGDVTLNSGTMWYAGTIAHDACHSVQYNVYKSTHPGQGVPADIYSGENAEAQCLEVQYRALQRLGASASTLTYMKSLLSTKYWTGAYSNRWW